MTVEKGYRTELSVDGVTIDERDVEMLEAIDRHGSIHAAADALGRSYARLQGRIVDLENALGDLTVRRRGGAGGGGTELTRTATELLRRFERHRRELEGVARATESVVSGTVRDRTGELATVETAAGPVVALVPESATNVQIGVRSDAIVLSIPGEDAGDRTSLRNRFIGTVSSVDPGDAVATVTLGCDGGIELETVITKTSLERLELEPGRAAVASFKATAARAISLEGDSESAGEFENGPESAGSLENRSEPTER